MLTFTWSPPGLDQIDLSLDYKTEMVEEPDGRFFPSVTITAVQPEAYAKAFYSAIDTDPELWPHVETECLEDWGISFEHQGD